MQPRLLPSPAPPNGDTTKERSLWMDPKRRGQAVFSESFQDMKASTLPVSYRPEGRTGIEPIPLVKVRSTKEQARFQATLCHNIENPVTDSMTRAWNVAFGLFEHGSY